MKKGTDKMEESKHNEKRGGENRREEKRRGEMRREEKRGVRTEKI
jgi:hypothetical protein